MKKRQSMKQTRGEENKPSKIEKQAEAKQARERSEFLAGRGIVINRYNRDMLKLRMAKSKTRRKRFGKVREVGYRKRRRLKARNERIKAIIHERDAQRKDMERRKRYQAKSRVKPPKFYTGEEAYKKRLSWAKSKAAYILLRYSERHARQGGVSHQTKEQD